MSDDAIRGGSKYQPLFEHLRDCGAKEISLRFSDIEAIVGKSLPASAKAQRAWWSNRKKGALQSRAWIDAGYEVIDIDLDEGRVTFQKPTTTYRVERKGDTPLWNGALIRGLRRHMGLTQAEFAERIGVYQQTVSNWENQTYEPRLSTSKFLSRVAREVGFQYDEVSENELDEAEVDETAISVEDSFRIESPEDADE